MDHFKNIVGAMLLLLAAYGCVEDPEYGTDVHNAVVPDVETLIDDDHPVQLTATSISFYANVASSGGVPVERYGVCWGTESNPVVESNDTSVCGSGTGEFVGVAKGLKANTLYYIRPYATNSVGTSYGDEFQRNTTEGLGMLRTFVIDSLVRAESAVVGGNIIDPGEGEILERGVYLTKKGTKLTDTIPFTMEADSFYQRVTGLEKLSTYEVEAYLVNTFGTISGGVLSFTTTDGIPVVAEPDTVSIGFTSATFTSKLLESGDTEITAIGFCYGTSPDPTLDNGYVLAELQADSTFTASIEVEQQTIYYVRAFATNSYGTVYSDGSGVSFILRDQAPTLEMNVPVSGSGGNVTFSGSILSEGMTPVTEAGFVWSVNENPTLETAETSHRNLFEAGLTDYSVVISGMRGSTTYYARMYATNSYGTTYSEVVQFTTPRIYESRTSAPGDAMLTYSQAAAYVGDNGFLLGGSTQDSQLTNTFLRYNATSDVWNTRASFPDSRKWQTLVAYNSSSLWAFGGIDANATMHNDLYIYYTRDNRWQQVSLAADAPSPDSLCNAMGMVDNLNIIIAGGRSVTGSSEQASNRVWSFSTTGSAWTELTPLPTAIYDGIALMADDRIYMGFGKEGTTVGGEAYYNTEWWSSPRTSSGSLSWKQETSFPGSTGVRAACVFDDDIYVIDVDGYMWCYDVAGGVWTEKTRLPQEIRASASVMFSLGDYIYIHVPVGSKLMVAYDPNWDNELSWGE